ncbi:MAG TPA: sugar kinase [Cyclobacteriaceae bacterium]|nr:sugar kinase [Cyclobacteriaceae bacterium]
MDNKKIVTFGEIMLRLSPPGYLRISQCEFLESSFGGGEANVAVSLANYGLLVEFVSRLPKNDIAEFAIKTLRKFNVKTDHIVYGGNRIGIYFLESGAVSRGSKVIYDRSNSAIAEIQPGMIGWDGVFQGAGWFHWTGITPAISQGAADACLEGIKKAREKGITISCDLNYRKNLWKYGKKAGEVMTELVKYSDIILGNEEDAEKVFGISSGEADVVKGEVKAEYYEPVAREMMKKFPQCKKVIITLRGSINASHNTWSGVLWNGKSIFKAPVYDITHIVDRVGGGDAFMGGLIFGLLTYDNDQKALDFAVAASCLKHTIKGDFNMVTVDEVEKLMGGDASGRVSR